MSTQSPSSTIVASFGSATMNDKPSKVQQRCSVTSAESAPSEELVTIQDQPRQPHMGLASSCNMIVGLIIGSGIFASPGPVTLKVNAVGPSLLVWAVGGILSMIGALNYAELGTMITRSGGEYQYLRSAFGLCVALIFSWSNLLLVNPLGTASIATVFAQYILQMAYFDQSNPNNTHIDMPEYVIKLVSIACIWVVVLFNSFALKAGTWVQNTFTAAKLIAVTMIIIIGWIWLGKGHTENFTNAFEGGSTNALDYGTAMYLALFSYNGWNNLNYGVSEVKNPKRTLPLAIVISCITVTSVYVLSNIAYFATLPVSVVATSSTVAMQLGLQTMGVAGAYFFALMVVLSTFGAVNANMWAASRLVVAAAEGDGVFMPPIFGRHHAKRQTPIYALVFVGVVSTIWCIPGNFTYLAKLYSFLTWLFYGITVLGLIVMRFKKSTRHVQRPFKIWLPLSVFFIIIDIYLIIAPLIDAGSGGVIQYVACIIIGLLAIPLWFIRVKRPGIGRFLFGWIPGYCDAHIVHQQLPAVQQEETETVSPDEESVAERIQSDIAKE